MLHPEHLNQFVRFQLRQTGTDAAGNVNTGPWVTVCERWCKYRPDYAREAVQQGRLHAKNTATLTTYRDPEVDTITEGARVLLLAGPHGNEKVAAVKTVTFDDTAEVSFIIQIGAEP